MTSLKALMTYRSKSSGCLAVRSAVFIKFLPAKAAQCRLKKKVLNFPKTLINFPHSNGSSPNVELPCNKINGLCVVAVLVATNACQQNQIVTDSEVKMGCSANRA